MKRIAAIIVLIMLSKQLWAMTAMALFAVTVYQDSFEAGPNDVAISAFSITPESIFEGEKATLSWATENATSCVPTGGTTEWSELDISLPDGNIEIEVAEADDYTFTLTCEGDAGTPPVAQTELAVDIDPNACVASPLIGVFDTWNNFWGSDFPLPRYANKDTPVYRPGFLSLEFETGSIVDNGLIVTVNTTFTKGIRLGAISKCPGDFNVANECDHSWGTGSGITWATDGKADACQLEPNTTYYFNLTFTDGSDPTSSTCDTPLCIAKIQHVNR